MNTQIKSQNPDVYIHVVLFQLSFSGGVFCVSVVLTALIRPRQKHPSHSCQAQSPDEL